jgi:ribosomal protein S12 methylthiotransferase
VKVNLVSLGCPKNLVDSENILGALGAAGTAICASPEESDMIIINTCGFIAPALEETEQTIREMLKYADNGKKVFVVGCAVNRCGDELKRKFPRVAGWFRLENEKKMIASIKENAAGIESRLPTTYGYAYLKISEGCSHRCAYCTIPSIKGPFRSFDHNKILEEAYELVKLGIKELILIGQDTTRYGYDLYGKSMLQPLLRDLSQIPGIEWLRIMYAHPKTIDEKIISEIEQNPKVCKYIDLPIQHINDRILELMNRATTQNDIRETMKRLKEIRDMVIRTTIIVGYPSESDDEFEELMQFVGAGYIDWLGVFPYYRETGTSAAELEGLPDDVIAARYNRATALQQKLLRQKNLERRDQVYKVLVHAREGEFIGHTEFAAPEADSQVAIADDILQLGEFYDVRITSTRGYDLHGELARASNGVC